MRTKTIDEWEAEMWKAVEDDVNTRGQPSFVAQLIDAIQSDASRSAARSERERAARVCDHAVRYHSLKCRQALKTTRRDIADSHKAVCDAADECARTIRNLPDVGDGEGEAV